MRGSAVPAMLGPRWFFVVGSCAFVARDSVTCNPYLAQQKSPASEAGLGVGCASTCLESRRDFEADCDCSVIGEFGSCEPCVIRNWIFSCCVTQHDVTHATCDFEGVRSVRATNSYAFAAVCWRKITGKPSCSGFIPDGKRAGLLVTKLASNTQRIADGGIVVAL